MTPPRPHPDDVAAVLATNRPRLLGIAADVQALSAKLTEQEMKPNAQDHARR